LLHLLEIVRQSPVTTEVPGATYEQLCATAEILGASVRIFRRDWGCVLVVSRSDDSGPTAAGCSFPNVRDIDVHAELLHTWLRTIPNSDAA
jgi:hypothetical protein